MSNLSTVQELAMLGLAFLAGGVATDAVFGRHDRHRARIADARARRAERRLAALEARTTVRRRQARPAGSSTRRSA